MAWNETERLKQRFQFICDVRWEDMDPTADAGVRTCGRCDKAVFTAASEAEFDRHARLGRCVFAPTTHGDALIAKPEGPPPAPPPLAGAPMPPRPEPLERQPDPDYGVAGIPAVTHKDLVRHSQQVAADTASDMPEVALTGKVAITPPPARWPVLLAVAAGLLALLAFGALLVLAATALL
jgi:hypothetical protein